MGFSRFGTSRGAMQAVGHHSRRMAVAWASRSVRVKRHRLLHRSRSPAQLYSAPVPLRMRTAAGDGLANQPRGAWRYPKTAISHGVVYLPIDFVTSLPYVASAVTFVAFAIPLGFSALLRWKNSRADGDGLQTYARRRDLRVQSGVAIVGLGLGVAASTAAAVGWSGSSKHAAANVEARYNLSEVEMASWTGAWAVVDLVTGNGQPLSAVAVLPPLDSVPQTPANPHRISASTAWSCPGRLTCQAHRVAPHPWPRSRQRARTLVRKLQPGQKGLGKLLRTHGVGRQPAGHPRSKMNREPSSTRHRRRVRPSGRHRPGANNRRQSRIRTTTLRP